MQYVIQRRTPLGDLHYIGETYDLNIAIAQVRELNHNRESCYKLYPVYIYDKLNCRVIRVHDKNHSPYWCVWVGGSSYSIGEPEYFGSIQAIKDELHERMNNQRRYPCVGNDTYFECYSREMNYDSGPDFIIKVGPRGGIIKESC